MKLERFFDTRTRYCGLVIGLEPRYFKVLARIRLGSGGRLLSELMNDEQLETLLDSFAAREVLSVDIADESYLSAPRAAFRDSQDFARYIAQRGAYVTGRPLLIAVL